MKKLSIVVLLIVVFSVTAVAANAASPRPNQPPVANNDEVFVSYQPTYVDIRVLDNDFDPEGHALTVVSQSILEGGSAVILKGQIIRVYLSPSMTPPDYMSGTSTSGLKLASKAWVLCRSFQARPAKWQIAKASSRFCGTKANDHPGVGVLKMG
jgi:hypothetical protein